MMIKRYGSLLVAFACVAALAACEGPAGPAGSQGPAGAQGPAGPTGPAGPAGQDANENCVQCHYADDLIVAVQNQYQNSLHYNGVTNERNGTSCAGCHTSQGFKERLGTGGTNVAAAIENPANVNCRTCHQIHNTYTSADLALTWTDPVDRVADALPAFDYGTGNLCAQCHQARPVNPVPVAGGPDISITSSRYGYHHGTQATVLAGEGAIEVGGAVNNGPNTHGNVASNAGTCATCHMAEAFGKQSGGHTWAMSYEFHGVEEDNVASCNAAACHGALVPFDAFDDTGRQTTVNGLLDDIFVELDRLGVVQDSAGLLWNASSGTPLVVSGDFGGSILNYQMFREDRSLGVHQPYYTTNILTNTLTVLQAIPAPPAK